MTSAPPVALPRLTLREKIGQTCQSCSRDIGDLSPEGLAAYLERYPVGSLFLGGEVIDRESEAAPGIADFIDRCQKASRLPLTIAGDLENGAGGAIRGMTAFPQLLALAATDDPAAAYEYGKWTAVEARRVGFHWAFGPVADLSLNWLNPIVSIRSLGDRTERVAALAAALIRGCQDHGLSAAAKHFPGDGVDFRDQHFCLSVNALPREKWEETFGRIYRECLAAGVHSVMAGHIALPWLDSRRGAGGAPIPATTSRPILHELLREELKFDGVVVSDALIMPGFRGRAAARADLLVEAFAAGIDVLLWPGNDYFDLMERALEDGRITEERLDRSVARILAMKARQGLLAAPAPVAPSIAPEPEARRFAESVAERSLTLVENRLDLLPLDPAKARRIQVLLATPRENGAAERIAPLLDGLRARGAEVALHVNGNCLDLRKREAAGERWDALVAVFETWTHGIKNTMRPTGAMAECMWTIQGLETVSPIVVSCGSPYLLHDMPWMETYVNAYSSSPGTLRALARALCGEIPFPGISPVDVGGGWSPADAARSGLEAGIAAV